MGKPYEEAKTSWLVYQEWAKQNGYFAGHDIAHPDSFYLESELVSSPNRIAVTTCGDGYDVHVFRTYKEAGPICDAGSGLSWLVGIAVKNIGHDALDAEEATLRERVTEKPMVFFDS